MNHTLLKILQKTRCLFRGHEWITLRINPRKNSNLAHLSPHAGKERSCAICGKHVDGTYGYPDDKIILPE